MKIVGERLFLFFEAFDALDERSQLTGGDGLRGIGDFVGHMDLQ